MGWFSDSLMNLALFRLKWSSRMQDNIKTVDTDSDDDNDYEEWLKTTGCKDKEELYQRQVRGIW